MPRIVQALTILTLLALAPALGQSSQSSFKPTNPLLVLPVGQELSDGELAEVEGRIFWGIVAGAVAGAMTEISRQAFSGQQADWGEIGKAALWGAVAGGLGGAITRTTASAVVAGAAGGMIAGAGRGASENPNANPRR